MYFSIHRMVTILALLSVLCACSKDVVEQAAEEVVTVQVKKMDVPIYGNYVARTDASLDVEVRARTTGFVESVDFVEGSWVNEGDLLYKIDDRPYKAKNNRLQSMAKLYKALGGGWYETNQQSDIATEKVTE